MASSFQVPLIVCVAVIYLSTPTTCQPVRDARGPTPFLSLFCSGNPSFPTVKGHLLHCILCKGFDPSCFTTTTTTSTTARPEEPSSSTRSPTGAPSEEP